MQEESVRSAVEAMDEVREARSSDVCDDDGVGEYLQQREDILRRSASDHPAGKSECLALVALGIEVFQLVVGLIELLK